MPHKAGNAGLRVLSHSVQEYKAVQSSLLMPETKALVKPSHGQRCSWLHCYGLADGQISTLDIVQ